MDDSLYFTEHHHQVREMVREFSRAHIAPIAKELDRTSAFPWENIKAMGELGLLGVPWSEELGGAGMDQLSYYITIHEMAPSEATLSPDAQLTMFHPSELELSETTQAVLEEVVKSKPRRVVFDSLSEMRLLAQNPLRYRRQILALKHLSASSVSNLTPWRLVSALAGSALLLGERLTSAWQVLGALIVLVGVQLSVLGLYLPPVFKTAKMSTSPPQTIISLPVQTAV